MAYDEELAERVRDLVDELLAAAPEAVEKRMFGGLAFLVGGHMAVAASREGGLLVRVDPAEGDELLASTDARPMVMRGRDLRGWLRVRGEAVREQPALRAWVERGVGYARSLPPKS
ncbi:TfoX/Sxy family protein [Nocardia bovistercoris]|uniref:TfoX/Sxy family protein n=1 Tax=Nocardia bovistercoris TaxID=2785916 RepID=A0A931I8A0_9NOCA|nr:TfoX/Sxy family protein [Nocardia bovistercoris]MBH0775695.1 TfoX/Sxy family protein [Nocardia bovistercoris]